MVQSLSSSFWHIETKYKLWIYCLKLHSRNQKIKHQNKLAEFSVCGFPAELGFSRTVRTVGSNRMSLMLACRLSPDELDVSPGHLAHPVPRLPQEIVRVRWRQFPDIHHLMSHQTQLFPVLGVIIHHSLSSLHCVGWWWGGRRQGNQTKTKTNKKYTLTKFRKEN